MTEKLILSGIGKYLRVGSKGNRFKLIIDDIVLSKQIKYEIEKNRIERLSNAKISIIKIQDYIRNNKIFVYVEEKKIIDKLKNG